MLPLSLDFEGHTLSVEPGIRVARFIVARFGPRTSARIALALRHCESAVDLEGSDATAEECRSIAIGFTGILVGIFGCGI